jgi:hypothetical protein
MATRATIACVNEDGTVHQVYHHWDGYLSGLGVQLLEYKTLESVAELVSVGDMSYIGMPYTHQGMDLNISKFSNINEFFRHYDKQEYNYLFHHGEWYVDFHESDGWIQMEKARAIEHF